jgi:hypothetical protein
MKWPHRSLHLRGGVIRNLWWGTDVDVWRVRVMKLSEIKANRALFIERVQAARSDASPQVDVNCGIKKPEDVSAIINNRVTEKPNWQPMYDYAAGFE